MWFPIDEGNPIQRDGRSTIGKEIDQKVVQRMAAAIERRESVGISY
jgi:hypothetical protein